MANKAFFYIRVSTTQQGRSGLGIEAQRQTLQHFAQAEGIEVLGEYVEVETGKRAFFTACSQASKAADYLRGLALAEAADIAA